MQNPIKFYEIYEQEFGLKKINANILFKLNTYCGGLELNINNKNNV